MTQTETLELLIATLQQTNASQSESIRELTRQNEQLQNKLDELLAQVAWLNRQLFGRKSEKLSRLDPNQLSLFEQTAQSLEPEPLEETVVKQTTTPMVTKKKERQNRKLLEGLPVVEVVIEPQDLDLTKYKRIGEKRTRTLEFEPGKLYVKEIIRPKPKSQLGQAIAYAYTLWPRMRNYLKDGRLKIDNNLAENAIRPIALSRKNFLFCGNHEAAENTAVICSLLASCKASQVNPREWLTDIIAWLPYYTRDKGKDLKELLPNYWKLRNSKEI